MHPSQVPHGIGRRYEEGKKYWMSEDGKKVLPRDISSHEAPRGYVAAIAVSETELGLDHEKTDATEVIDASEMTGAALSFDQGHVAKTQPRVPVSIPNAAEHPDAKERIKARGQLIDQEGAKVEPPAAEEPGELNLLPPEKESKKKTPAKKK